MASRRRVLLWSSASRLRLLVLQRAVGGGRAAGEVGGQRQVSQELARLPLRLLLS